MQAPTVQNQTNVTSAPTPAAKPQNAPDVPFNQMLSQQIADRSNVSSNTNDTGTNQASNVNKVNDTNKANDTNKNNDTSKAGNSDPAPVSKQSSSDAADATDTKLVGKDKIKDADAAMRTDISTGQPISAELMALVVNHLSQANTKPADASATAVAATTAAAGEGLTSKVDVSASLAAGRTIASDKDSLTAQTELKASTEKMPTAELTGKEASAKQGAGFAATMSAIEQAADSKQSLQIASAKLQEALPAVATGATPQLQQTALNIAQAVAGNPSDKLTPQVGSPGWDQALGQKVVWMVAGTQQSASLTLNPPDLGPMQVVLNVTNGHADAAFTSNQPEVRQALEAALPKLREMMSDAGIQLGQATISAGMPNQQNRSGEQTSQNSRSFSQTGDTVDATVRLTGTTKIIGGQGLVDTFA